MGMMSVRAWAAVAAVATPAASAKPTPVQQPVLAWSGGARSDWIDVTRNDVCTKPAKGDGKTDDTDCLSQILFNISGGQSHMVVYFPPGTYRITRTLTANKTIGAQFIGHGRATTLKWAGEKNGTIFVSAGCTKHRYVGLHWDGAGVAGIGVLHQSINLFETEITHEAEAFSNFLEVGIAVISAKHAIASAEILYRNTLFENSNVGVLLNNFNDYDNTFDGCLFRNLAFGIYSRAGISYLRNTRFENSSQCDFNIGVFWAFQSLQRVVSVGSRMFVCEAVQWGDFGGPYKPWAPGFVGPGGQHGPDATSWWGPAVGAVTIRDCHVDAWTGPVAVNVSGTLQVHDSTFSNPANASAVAVQHLYGNDVGFWPVLLSNNTATGAGGVVNATAPDPRNLTYTLPRGQCAATGVTAATTFYKQTWPTPGRVFDVTAFLPPVNNTKPPSADVVTKAVQACIDAAAKAGNGAVAYFPKGSYALNGTVTVSGKDFYVSGCGYQTLFSWARRCGPTPGCGGPMLDVAPGSRVTFEFFQLFPANATADVVRLLVRGGGGTNVTVNGVQMQGYNENKRPWASGIRVEGFRPRDLLDVVYTDGDVTAVGNEGTVILGFHLAGQVVLEPSQAQLAAYQRAALAGPGQPAAAPKSGGVFGELMRFTCCAHDFTTKVGPGQRYVVENLYQESGVNYVHAQGAPGAPPGSVVVSAIKTYTTSTTQSVVDGWAGLWFTTAGGVNFQPTGSGGPEKVNVVVNGTADTRLVFLLTQPSSDLPVTGPTEIDVTNPRATLTQIGNAWTNDTMYWGSPVDTWPPASVPDAVEGLDALRRLARVDLEVHYPELGVRDTCVV